MKEIKRAKIKGKTYYSVSLPGLSERLKENLRQNYYYHLKTKKPLKDVLRVRGGLWVTKEILDKLNEEDR